jgi:UDP-glucuronate decarboxylase
MVIQIYKDDGSNITSRTLWSRAVKPNLAQLGGKIVTITGSTGFIGGALLESLRDTKVYLHTPDREDLLNRAYPKSDIILHCAGYGQPSLFMQQPINTIQVNTRFTAELLESLKPGGSFLFCSSSEIYNGFCGLATEEDIGTATPSHPRACYIQGKLCGEVIVNSFRAVGRRAFSARISPTYGPGTRMRDAKAMSQFIEQALLEKKIVLQDSGQAVRMYGYIADTVEMLWGIVLSGTQPSYNVGGKTVISIAELALLIGEMTGAGVVIPKDTPDQIGGSPVVRLDLSRYEKEFGKTEYVSLEEGLRKTIEYQRKLYGVL